MYKVAIVDDEITALKTLKKYFEMYASEFEVTEMFDNGFDMINYLKDNYVDVVFTDVKMPEISGIDVAKWIYENRPDIKVVIVSGYSEFQWVQEAMRYKVMYYLLKVIDIKEFIEVIDLLSTELKQDSFTRSTMNLQRFFYNLMFGTFKSDNEMNLIFHKITGNDANIAMCRIVLIKILEIDLKTESRHDDDDREAALENFIRLLYNNNTIVTISKNNNEFDFVMLNPKDSMDTITETEIENEIFNILKIKVQVKKIIKSRISQLYKIVNEEKINDDDKNKLINSETLEESNLKGEFIERIKIYIDSHYSEQISRKIIADHFSMNVDYIGRQFKEITNKNLTEYIQEKRIKKAMELMKEGKSPEESCGLVGYVDFRSFKRLFKKFAGMGIGEYRKKSKNEENK